MKKGLLATSALMGASLLGAPAFAAAPTVADNLALTITGNMRSTLIVYNQDQTDGRADAGRGYSFRGNDESEIIFRARAKADNGLAYGFDIEVQTQTDDTTNADEVWFFIDSPTFGRIEIGDQDDAPDRIMIDGADAQAGRGGNNFSVDTGGMVADHGRTALDSAGITNQSDASKIIYFTPRWAGFQGGVSFTPDSGQSGAGAANDANGNFKDTWGFGVNYQNTFSGARVTIAGTFQTGDHETSGTEGADIWGVGAQIVYAGFTFAAGYADHGETGQVNGNDAGKWWNIGLRYTTGPWDFSVGYFQGWADAPSGAADTRDMTHDQAAISATYRVAPGWVLAGDIIWFDMENRTPTTANADDTDGWMFVLSSTLTF